MNTLGNRIKNERKARKLSQSELGDLLGIKNTQVSNYEKDISVPPSDTLSMMADIFNCSTDYLLGRTDFKNGEVIEITLNGHSIKIIVDGSKNADKESIITHFTNLNNIEQLMQLKNENKKHQ